jgi:hypothetical protein
MNASIDRETVALLDELSPHPTVSPDWDDVVRRAPRAARGTRRAWAVRGGVALAVAAAVLTVTWLWPQNRASVVQEALGAIDSGPVLHGVVQTVGARLVDLRSGAQSPVAATTELWYDERVGTFAQTRFRGEAMPSVYLPAGKPSRPTVHLDVSGRFLTGYRSALRRGQVRLVGEGHLRGVAVDWLEGEPFVLSDSASGAGIPARFRVAVDRKTFKPVYAEVLAAGRRVSALRVLSIGTTTLARSPLAHPVRSHGPIVWRTPAKDTPATTLQRAASEMGKAPIVPSRTIGGLRRAWVGQPLFLVGTRTANLHEPAGVVLFYGHRQSFGQPDYLRPYVAISEFPSIDPLFTAQGRGYFPAAGKAVEVGTTLTFRQHGLYVQVKASSPALALAGARAVARG